MVKIITPRSTLKTCTKCNRALLRKYGKMGAQECECEFPAYCQYTEELN